MNGTIEKGVPLPAPSFEKFCAVYRAGGQIPRPMRRRIASCFLVQTVRGRRLVDAYRLGFELRVRVPDASGYFARGHRGGPRWCWPWQWARLYYDVRYGGRA